MKSQPSKVIKLNIKPLSINQAYQGRRFKTPAYNAYTKKVLLMLPKMKLPEPPYEVYYEFGFSSKASDWDNPIKPIQDLLSTKYKFNDKLIFCANVKKIIVPKGKEYIKFKIEHYEQE